MNQPVVIPKWWLNLAKSLLIFTVITVFVFLFSFWAKDAEFFGAHNFSTATGFIIFFLISFVTLDWLAVLSAVGIVSGFFLKYPIKNYLIMLVLSLASTYYINTFHS